MWVISFHNLSIGWFSLFIGKHYHSRKASSTTWFMSMKDFLYKPGKPKQTKFSCDSHHWQELVCLLFDFVCGPYFLRVTHCLIQFSHVDNFDSLSAHRLKLTSRAHQKIPLFLCASDHRTWTLVPLSFIKTNFRILWSAASRMIASAFLNHIW